MNKASNLHNGKRIAVMHGELWVRPVDTVPTGKTEQYTRYVAAHSETGHHHVVESKAGMEVTTTEDGKRYLLIRDVSKLFHQKTQDVHETRYLAPGAYELTEKTEYDPFQQVIRKVWD